MFYLDPNTYERYYLGRPFTYNGIQYARAGATHENFIGFGFNQITVQPRPSDRFYEVSGPNDDGSWNAVPRDLETLKNNLILATKREAHARLQATDWYVVRMMELGYNESPVPVNITNYRASVRNISDVRCASLQAATSIAELEPAYATLSLFPEAPEAGAY